jgi:hypothetical protein
MQFFFDPTKVCGTIDRLIVRYIMHGRMTELQQFAFKEIVIGREQRSPIINPRLILSFYLVSYALAHTCNLANISLHCH